MAYTSGRPVKTTRYFEEQVLRKRPYIRIEWCEQAVRSPVRREVQVDGRVRHWIFVKEIGKYLTRRDLGGWRNDPQRLP